MKGLSLSIDRNTKQLTATVDPLILDKELKQQDVEVFISTSDFNRLFILSDNIAALCDAVSAGKASNSIEEQVKVVAEIRDASAQIEVSSDKMSVTLAIECAYAGDLPTYDVILDLLKEQGITRGISKKRINSLLFQASESEGGAILNDVIAKGLPARDGRASYLQPLFPNAIDRILQPQEVGNNKVNMRNLGDILCVQQSTAIAQRIQPSSGRLGFNVCGEVLPSQAGELCEINLGANTKISERDANVVIAAVAGQPKFENDVMTIEDTYQTKGVNVGTGNVKYEGAVIVSGDVTESMEVIATGDITINGFVESAVIRAGGDIIITEGAMGKMKEEDCILHAQGSVFVQHGQGLDIYARKNLNVRKQLAYSRVKCLGKITIGESDKPQGSIFASSLQCGSSIYAGIIGAVSGSALNIDFSERINDINKRYDALLIVLKQLRENSFDHEVKLRNLKAKHIPSALANDIAKITSMIESEKQLLVWLESTEAELRHEKDEFEKNAKIVAYKELYPGVSIKMNKRTWRSEKEYMKSVISLIDGKWEYNPIVN